MNLLEQMMKENKKVSKEERKKSKISESVSRSYVAYEIYFPSTYEDDKIREIGKTLSAGYPSTDYRVDPDIRVEQDGKLAGWKILTVRISEDYMLAQASGDFSGKIYDKINDPSVIISTVGRVTESKSRRRVKESTLTSLYQEIKSLYPNIPVKMQRYPKHGPGHPAPDFRDAHPGVFEVDTTSLSEDEVREIQELIKTTVNRTSDLKFVTDLGNEVITVFGEKDKTTESKSRRREAVIKRHPSKYDVANAGRFGNPYDRKFASEEERQQAIKSYEKKIQAAETRLDRNAKMSSPFGGYDNWHEDKDSIGYMYDRLSLMKSAKLKESRRRVTERIRDIGPAIRADVYIEELNNYLDTTYGFYLDEIDQDTFVAVSLDQQVKLLTEDICKEIGAVMLSESTCKLSLPKGRQFAYSGDLAADDDEVLELAVQFNDVIKYSFGQKPAKTPSLVVAQLLTNCYSQTKDPTGWSTYHLTDNASLEEFWNDIYDKETSGSNIAVISYI